MEIVNFQDQSYMNVGASGVCPHCGINSYFRPVTQAYIQTDSGSLQQIATAVACQTCKKFALVIASRSTTQAFPWTLRHFFPVGKPSDDVDPSVPREIATDFAEALRCEWVQAYKATVTMCRRALQGSAIGLGADPSKKLVAQIDELFGKGKITEALRDYAHEIRLTGNDGAHPDNDDLENVTKKDAEDIIAFTRQCLEHVYIMPARLRARKPPMVAAGGPATT